jgi:hypothetical protein
VWSLLGYRDPVDPPPVTVTTEAGPPATTVPPPRTPADVRIDLAAGPEPLVTWRDTMDPGASADVTWQVQWTVTRAGATVADDTSIAFEPGFPIPDAQPGDTVCGAVATVVRGLVSPRTATVCVVVP